MLVYLKGVVSGQIYVSRNIIDCEIYISHKRVCPKSSRVHN